jgi:hypothetical protein
MNIGSTLPANQFAAHAIAQAQAAMGPVVKMEPREFITLVERADDPLVVVARNEVFFVIRYQYLLGYKGLVFFTKSKAPLDVAGRGAEIISAKGIRVA